ncbi:hypothetical protein [Limnohabitans sp.]|uniref:hypothetical protein n=1 Tax=Limnohabitans sp. TaxID=1907725 RepID=UPI00286F365A|nr:hypothetical protein [Limnohabitans sp.]
MLAIQKPSLVQPPRPPSLSNPVDFDAKADAFVGWFPSAWLDLQNVIGFVEQEAGVATTKAGEASMSATDASNSARIAATKADDSSSSANAARDARLAAENARDQALAAFDSFDDRYLGAKSSDPTVDNDGNTLLTGAIYFNISTTTMRVWNGTAWQAQSAMPDTLVERSFLATAGQNSYTITGGYRVGYTFVWVNGSMLYTSGFTATDGTTITFNPALALNDKVRVLSIKSVGAVAVADIVGLQAALDARLPLTGGALTGALREAKVAMAGNNIDINLGNCFTKTISGATTLTVSNVPAAGTLACFILDLTNGGSATITWWSRVKWASGTAPMLTVAGRDVLGFFTHDGGITWTGLVLQKDVK